MQTVDGLAAKLGASSLTYDMRVDLVDADLNTVRQVDAAPEASQVTYQADRTVPFGCSLALYERLNWSTALLRPTMIVGDIDVRLGVFVPAWPTEHAGWDRKRWEVDGYDLTSRLDFPHGRTVTLDEGDPPLDLAEQLAADRGLVVEFSAKGDAKVASRDRIWPLDSATTTRSIVNDLLEDIGYEPVWMDWQGRLRARPDRAKSDRGSEWSYDTADDHTTVAADRTLDSNRVDIPNRLVAISSAATAWDPVTGDGIAIVEDADDIAAHGERTKVITVDAVDQEELEEKADRRWERARRVVETVEFDTLPNPAHWHDDVVRFRDADLGLNRRLSVSSWTLPLDGVTLQTVEGQVVR